MEADESHNRTVDMWDGGLTWIAHTGETMQRASQALIGAEGLWLIDPVDMPGLDDILDELGPVVGVAVLLDRHTRDVASIANRHAVPIAVPETLQSTVADVAVPVVPIETVTDQTGFECLSVIDMPGWHEYALYDGETLVVAEALGTAAYFRGAGEQLGVHPMLRLRPPRKAFREVFPERILVGHGPGLRRDGTAALHDALAGARRRAPQVYLRGLGKLPNVLFEYVRH